MAALGNLRARSGTRLFPGRAEAVSAVRFYLAELLNGCPVADEVILCASELAANAVIHSDSGQPEGQFAVRAEVCPGQYVRVEVGDQGGSWSEFTHDDRPHGLDLVRLLAGEGNWGITGSSSGRVAWARLSWAASVR
jgi:anti-sigma regulatory factor (Ser/Thr protein kinase)